MEIIYEVSPFFTKLKMLAAFMLLTFITTWILTLPFDKKGVLPIKWPAYIFLIPLFTALLRIFESWSVLNERYETYLSGGMEYIEGTLINSEVSMRRDFEKDGDIAYRVEVNLFISEDSKAFYFNRVSPKIRSGGQGCHDMVLSQNIEDYYGKKMRVTFLPIPSDTLKEPIKCIFKIEVEA